MSLTEVFPVEPVIPTSGQPSSRRQARASDCSAAQRIVGREHPARRRVGELRRRAPGSTTTPHAPGRERRRGVRAAVGALAAQAEEQVAGLDARASRSPPARAGPSPPSRDDLGPGLGGDPLGRELDHAARRGAGQRPQLLPRRPRDRRTGSCGRARTPGPARGPCRRSRPCRPARAAPSASAIAAAPVGLDLDLGARRPARSRRGSRR